MFFLLSSFRFCPLLKNDGSGELRFREAVNDFLYKRKNRECKPSLLVGEGVSGADGRGKRENKQKNRNSVSKTLKNSFNLCTHTYPFRLAKLGTSLRVRGKLTTKEERNHSF